MTRVGGQQEKDFGGKNQENFVNPRDFSANLKHGQDMPDKKSAQKSQNVNSLGKEQSDRNIDVMNEFPIERDFRVENVRGIIEGERSSPLKYRTMTIKGLGLNPPVLSASGLPSVDVKTLNLLAGDPPNGKFGTAYNHFK